MQELVFSEQTEIRISHSQVSCDLGDEAVILELDQGIYYALNPVAKLIWDLIRKTTTFGEIKNSVLHEYDVVPERCEYDLKALLTAMAEKKLIEIKNGPAP